MRSVEARRFRLELHGEPHHAFLHLVHGIESLDRSVAYLCHPEHSVGCFRRIAALCSNVLLSVSAELRRYLLLLKDPIECIRRFAVLAVTHQTLPNTPPPLPPLLALPPHSPLLLFSPTPLVPLFHSSPLPAARAPTPT